MDMDLFRKIVDEAVTIQHIKTFILHGLGEPLLDPKLDDRIWYIRQVAREDSIVQIFTNGVYLTPDRFDRLKKVGLDSVVVSLNAVRSEQHEEIMGLKGKFDQVCSNIENAISQGGPRIDVRAVLNEDQFNGRDAISFYQRWGEAGYSGHGKCINEGNWAGDGRTIRTWKPNEACRRALESIYVLFDGRVTTCCFDPTGRQVFGDLSRQTLRQVYGSANYVKFRETHYDNRADEYDICRDCTRI
jgi:radical SAM protein with 4Fe4S-binding SPASM domain